MYGPSATFKVKKTHKSSKNRKRPGRPVLVEGEECVRTSFLLTKSQWLFLHCLVNMDKAKGRKPRNASDFLRMAVELLEAKHTNGGII